MDELKKLINALACINEVEKYVEDFKGVRDFLDNVKEPLEEVKIYISDTIAINATKD